MSLCNIQVLKQTVVLAMIWVILESVQLIRTSNLLWNVVPLLSYVAAISDIAVTNAILFCILT